MLAVTRASAKVGARVVATRGAVLASTRQATLAAVRARENISVRSIQTVAQTDRVRVCFRELNRAVTRFLTFKCS
jgi:N-acetyl-gamma-glutamyl-phosphate reductase / acetylglutamate kinase